MTDRARPIPLALATGNGHAMIITLSGVFITLSGSNYSIGRLLHYRLVHKL